MNAPKEAKNPLYSMQQDVLLWALPIAAVCIALLTYASIVASLLHVKELTHKYNDQFRGTPDSLPEIAGNGFLRGLGRLSTYGLPAVIILAWVVILGVQISQTINESAAPI
ncbi:MAG: hypothetical protein EOP11_23690 [Proteobacteria bacterium]|nr:MAG: hypothetical protein EOP11_23690 [Pseudomonadota bacterium]